MTHPVKTKRSSPRLVVGVGASAGGLDAFKALLRALPADGGMAFLLVQHLDPAHPSLLVHLLAPFTSLKVTEAEDGAEVRADTVYVLPPNASVGVRRGRLTLRPLRRHAEVRGLVDELFRSLAGAYPGRSAAVVLSGAGSDGSEGIRDVRASGGLTIAQSPGSSTQDGMPRAAIATGSVNLVLDIADIPAALDRFAALDVADDGSPSPEERESTLAIRRALDEQHRERLTSLLGSERGFDLRAYKDGTLVRRLQRRMTLSGFEQLGPYLDRVQSDRGERQALVRDLLISVTNFFRDPDTFRALRESIIDPLVARAGPHEAMRVWVAGCATGEEAYSLGIELLESLQQHGKLGSPQIFATDVDEDALCVARTGLYQASIEEHVSSDRLETYFKRAEDGAYRVTTRLRDTVSFATHDLTRDPPFSRMHLVSCRNVLIYLTPKVQEQVLRMFHFALESDGALFLGSSESPSREKELFATVSKSHRIYTKVGISSSLSVAPALSPHPRTRVTEELRWSRAPASRGREPKPPTELASRAVMRAWVPATIVVGGDGGLLLMHGDLGDYLKFPEGDDPRLELFAVLREELAARTRGALYRCRQSGEPVVAVVGLKQDAMTRVRITVKPAPELGDGATMISFEQVEGEAPVTVESHASREQDVAIEHLERELQATREDLRSTVSELESSNEELRSSNEEVMSINEELQSANEELEATTEELRSVNEELTTVNVELRDKVHQLERAHDDLNNFFSSTKIATIFLDTRLCIKRFTPSTVELLEIDETHIGRCVKDIARELVQNDLELEAAKVLESLTPVSRELQTRAGRWIVRRVLPYRTESQRIEGAVVTFADVTDLKVATQRIAVRERQQSVIARVGLQALREPSVFGFLDRVVRDVQQTLDSDFCKILELQPGGQRLLLRAGVGWAPGLVGTAYVGSGPDSQAGYTLHSMEPVIVNDLATERRFSGPSLLLEHEVKSGLSCVIRDGDHIYGVIGAHTRGVREFTREDAAFLQAVAGVIGSAIGRHLTRTRLSVEVAVAQELAAATSVDDALPAVVERLAKELGASVGELWTPQENNEQVHCTSVFTSSEEDRTRIAETFSHRVFRVGEGLVGRVLLTGGAVWCTDLGDPTLFARRDAAKRLGLLSGFAFPVAAGRDVRGVIALFSRERLFGDEVFLRSLETVGRSIGEFTRRTDAEQRTRASEVRKAAMLDAALDGIVTIDHAGMVLEFNAAAQEMFGYSEEEALGREMAEIVIPERLRDAHRAGLARVISGGTPRVVGKRIEMPALRRDGSEFPVELVITRIDDGRELMFTGFIRDITERKRSEDALREADRQKDEFLAMLGHELRNPLAAIRTATELLKRTAPDDERLARAQGVLERQTTHMARLLDGLLDVSRIIRGKIHLEAEVLDLKSLCRQVIHDVKERGGTDRLHLVSDLGDEPVFVMGDRVRLAQIIDNLLSNAVKYTPEGGTVTTRLRAHDGTASLRVIDNGVGIDPELLPYVFDVFRQSEQSLDRSFGGLGLGLALVKSLAELHGGSVEAKSEGRGKGAELVVRLPLTESRPAAAATTIASPPHAREVLLIDDNEDASRMLRELLELTGHQVMVASRGREGVALARERRPSVVLCDLGLPDGMTGYDVAKELRRDPSLSGLCLVALSGYGRPEDKAKSAEAGFDTHLTKPVDLEALEQMFAELGVEKGQR